MPRTPNRFGPRRFRFLLPALLTMLGAGFDKITELPGGNVNPYHSGEMAFSPDSRTLALPKEDGRVELCDLTTGKVTDLACPHGGQVRADQVTYSKQGRLLAVNYGARGMAIWDVPGKKVRVQLPFDSIGVEFTDGDRTLLGLDLKRGHSPNPQDWHALTVRWDVATGKRLDTVDFGPSPVFRALSPDGRYAVLQDLDKFRVLSLATRKKLFDLPDFGEFLFSEDGTTLVSYIRGRLSLLEVPSGKLLRHLGDHYPDDSNSHSLSLSRDKRLLAVGRFNGNHRAGVIDLVSGKILGTFACGAPEMICKNIRISPDGRTVATNTEAVNTQDQPVSSLLKLWKIPASW